MFLLVSMNTTCLFLWCLWLFFHLLQLSSKSLLPLCLPSVWGTVSLCFSLWLMGCDCLPQTRVKLNLCLSVSEISWTSWSDVSVPAFLCPNCRRNTESASRHRYQHTEEVCVCVLFQYEGCSEGLNDAGAQTNGPTSVCACVCVCVPVWGCVSLCMQRSRELRERGRKKNKRKEVEREVLNKRWWLPRERYGAAWAVKLDKRPQKIKSNERFMMRKKMQELEWSRVNRLCIPLQISIFLFSSKSRNERITWRDVTTGASKSTHAWPALHSVDQ